MQYGTIRGIDTPVSRIGQGAVMLSQDKTDEGFELLDAVFESGINFFDSAHGYGGGQCDRVFGQWVKARGLEGKVVLLDKCCHHHGDTQRVTPEGITAR